MAIDKFGRAHVVWKGLNATVWYAMLDRNGTIKVPAMELYSHAMDAAPRVAVDDHGDAHVVSTTLVGSYLDYAKVSEGRRVAGSAFHLFVPGGFYESEMNSRPSIAIDPVTQLPVIAAEVHASYEVDLWGFPTYYYDNYVAIVTLDLTRLQPNGNPDRSAVWAPFLTRDTISPDFRAQFPEVTVDSGGTIHCVWLHWEPNWEGSGVGYWHQGRAWHEIAATRNVAGEAGRPRITSRKVGCVDVVWSTTSGSVLWHEMDLQGQPLPNTSNLRISAPEARAARPQIAAGVGTVAFAWLDQREGISQLYGFNPSEDSTERNVVCSTNAVFGSGVASHRLGSPAYVWHQAREGPVQIFFRCEKVISTYDPNLPPPTARASPIRIEVPPETPPSIARISGNNLDQFVERGLLMKITTDFPGEHLRIFVQPVACSGGHLHDSNADVTVAQCPSLSVDEAIENDAVDTVVDPTRRHGLLRRMWDPHTSPLHDEDWPSDEYGRTTGTHGYSDLAHSFNEAETDANGVAWVYYIAPEVSGDEVVTVVYGDEPRTSKAQVHISIAVPGLEPLSGSALNRITLIGQTKSHPESHYGTGELLQALDALARNFTQDKTYFPVAGQSEALRVNDISLPHGGAFDIGLPSNGPYWGYGSAHANHLGHKRGYEVDIGIRPKNDAFAGKRLYFGEEIVEKQGWWINDPRLWAAEETHYHLVLSGAGGKPSIVFSAAAVIEEPWNPATQKIRFSLPYDNQGGVDAAEVGITAIRLSEGATITLVNSMAVDPALQGSLAELVGIVPERYLPLGAAAIRSPRKLDIEALVRPEVPWFAVQWNGFSTRPTGPSIAFPFYPTIGLSWIRSRTGIALASGPEPPDPDVETLQVTLLNPSQPAQPGDVVTYEGEIRNLSGAPVVLSGGNLNLKSKLPPRTLACEFAPEFLATGGVIGIDGYRGPLVAMTWGPEVPDGTVVSGTIELVFGSEPVSTTLPEPFHAYFNPRPLRISRSEGQIILAWPKAAAGLMLERAEDVAVGEWVRDYQPIVERGAENTVTIDPGDDAVFFRLHP